MNQKQITHIAERIRACFGSEMCFTHSDVALIWMAAQDPDCALAAEAQRYVHAEDVDHYADFVVATHDHVKKTLYRAPPSVLRDRKEADLDFMDSTETSDTEPFASFPYRSVMEFHDISSSPEHPCSHLAAKLLEELRSFYAQLPGVDSAPQRIREVYAQLRANRPLAAHYIYVIESRSINLASESWDFARRFAEEYPEDRLLEPYETFRSSLEAAAESHGIRTQSSAASGGTRESLVPAFSAELAHLDAAAAEFHRWTLCGKIVKTITDEMKRAAGNRRPAHHGPFSPPEKSLKKLFGDRVGVVVSDLWPALHAYQFTHLPALAELPPAWVEDISDLVWRDSLGMSLDLDFRDPDNLKQHLSKNYRSKVKELAGKVWHKQRSFDRSRLPSLSQRENSGYASVAARRLVIDLVRDEHASSCHKDHSTPDGEVLGVEKNIPRSTYKKHEAAQKTTDKIPERAHVVASVLKARRRKRHRSELHGVLTAGEWAKTLGIPVTTIGRAIKEMVADGQPLPSKSSEGSFELDAQDRCLIEKYLPVSTHLRIDADGDGDWQLDRLALLVVRKAHGDVQRRGKPTAELRTRLDEVRSLVDRAAFIEVFEGDRSIASLRDAVLRLYKKRQLQARNKSQPSVPRKPNQRVQR